MCHFLLLAVPPQLISSAPSATNVSRSMNERTTLSCEVAAKPNIELFWSRSLHNLTLHKYNMSTYLVTGEYIYNLTYAFHSALQFSPSSVYTCENVNEFDGKYTCEGKWIKESISQSFINYNVTTECKYRMLLKYVSF